VKYLNKTFSVYNNYNSQPKCRCGQIIKIGYVTKWGYLCNDCYNQEKNKKEIESNLSKL